MKQVLIVSGGWEGHQPAKVSRYFKDMLTALGCQVTIVDALAILSQNDKLKHFDLIVMNWTRGELTDEQFAGINDAVISGVGLAGVHGGLTSAFQHHKKWLWLTGGCFVAHPGGVDTHYSITIQQPEHPIMKGSHSFSIQTEQYYVLVDPAIDCLATTKFEQYQHPNAANPQPIDIPVAWTKRWGRGRIFFHSLGHDLSILQQPEVESWTKQGFLWACR